jgi:hypothetical protein
MSRHTSISKHFHPGHSEQAAALCRMDPARNWRLMHLLPYYLCNTHPCP